MTRTYKVREIRSCVDQGKLCITAAIQEMSGGVVLEARLPARETAALLPREIILGDERESSQDILELMDDMLMKLVVGRVVRAWEYSDCTYFSFLKWGAVRFNVYSSASAE